MHVPQSYINMKIHLQKIAFIDTDFIYEFSRRFNPKRLIQAIHLLSVFSDSRNVLLL